MRAVPYAWLQLSHDKLKLAFAYMAVGRLREVGALDERYEPCLGEEQVIAVRTKSPLRERDGEALGPYLTSPPPSVVGMSESSSPTPSDIPMSVASSSAMSIDTDFDPSQCEQCSDAVQDLPMGNVAGQFDDASSGDH